MQILIVIQSLTTMSIKPKQKTPSLSFELLEGGTWNLADQSPKNFTMVVFYRGLHCPICSTYLKDLDNKLSKFKAKGVDVVAVSSDTENRARQSKKEWELENLAIGYGVTLDKAREWNLFISSGINEKEPDQFIEPGLFLIRPDQTLYAASIQTMPFARPQFSEVLGAMDFVLEHSYPARGEV